MCTLSDRAETRELSWPLMEQYCRRFGYAFVARTETMDPSRHIAWSKILLLRELAASGEYDVVLWMDDDLIVTRPDLRLEHLLAPFLASGAREPIAISRDAHGWPFNSGMMAVRCDMPGVVPEIFDTIYATAEPDSTHGLAWEQTGMTRLYARDPTFRSQLYIYAPGIIQGFFRDTDPIECRWHYGTFAAHVTCHRRISKMQFLHRHFFINDAELARMIINVP